jgi:hypothetical protein
MESKVVTSNGDAVSSRNRVLGGMALIYDLRSSLGLLPESPKHLAL